jgi:quercetin dioxygenase-like cupin family protein
MFNPKHLTTVATLALTSAIAPAGHATEDVTVHELVAKSLREFPGKEVLMIEVTFAPGAADPVHRHDAHGFIYVLEGSIVMQVEGGEEVTLTAGQTFYEGPSDLHIVGRNASDTVPARFLAVLVKNEGAPVLTVQ